MRPEAILIEFTNGCAYSYGKKKVDRKNKIKEATLSLSGIEWIMVNLEHFSCNKVH